MENKPIITATLPIEEYERLKKIEEIQELNKVRFTIDTNYAYGLVVTKFKFYVYSREEAILKLKEANDNLAEQHEREINAILNMSLPEFKEWRDKHAIK